MVMDTRAYGRISRARVLLPDEPEREAVHRAYVAAEARAGWPAEFDFPAERAFPVPVVAGHGLLAGTTFTLVLLTMLAG